MTDKELCERLRAEEHWAIERSEAELKREAADRIEALTAEVERLRGALKTAGAWLDRWARHIGDCPGIDACTCGLTRVRYEATTALAGDSHE